MSNGVLDADCAFAVPTVVKAGSNERVSCDLESV